LVDFGHFLANLSLIFFFFSSTAPLLRAEQFIPGNKDHLLILKAMGISVTKTDDGKVQLMQDASAVCNVIYGFSYVSTQ
jgi:hypothetical protein